ncbi:MAG TPA: hypothetical protein VEC16_04665 [Alphaproteobacteria bacterium]|nr:hypothetical protein [Alphaproteobacteria bacterium]
MTIIGDKMTDLISKLERYDKTKVYAKSSPISEIKEEIIDEIIKKASSVFSSVEKCWNGTEDYIYDKDAFDKDMNFRQKVLFIKIDPNFDSKYFIYNKNIYTGIIDNYLTL